MQPGLRNTAPNKWRHRHHVIMHHHHRVCALCVGGLRAGPRFPLLGAPDAFPPFSPQVRLWFRSHLCRLSFQESTPETQSSVQPTNELLFQSRESKPNV